MSRISELLTLPLDLQVGLEAVHALQSLSATVDHHVSTPVLVVENCIHVERGAILILLYLRSESADHRLVVPHYTLFTDTQVELYLTKMLDACKT